MNTSEYITELDAISEARKNAILTSPSFQTADNRAFFVSNGGDDSADGTRSHPWRTLEKVNEFDFESGDAVFFERGGLWRGQLKAKGGVKYSAYGEGIKPRLYGSDKNYAACEWSETEIKNVYVLDEPVERDAGLIVFDGGASHSVKRIIGVSGFTGDIRELDRDLQFWHGVDDKKIYLYSDGGNPSTRFASIEIAVHRHLCTASGDNITFDNLTFKYTGSHGIGVGTMRGLTVKNCEFGWIGGSIQGINSTTRYGNAVEIWGGCKNYTINGSYFYQIYDAAITHQFKGKSGGAVTMENVLYRGNLIELCTYSIEYFLDASDDVKQTMRNIRFEDNICRYAGCGFGDQRPDRSTPAHIKGWSHTNPAMDFTIENNIFDRSHISLVDLGATKPEWLPIFRGNTYIQNKNGLFGRCEVNPAPQYSFAQAMQNKFPDKEGKYYQL